MDDHKIKKSESLSEAVFAICERDGCITNVDASFYSEFIALSDKYMVSIIKGILWENADDINRMAFDPLAQSEAFDAEIAKIIRTSLSLMSMGVLGFNSDWKFCYSKPVGPGPSPEMQEKIETKIKSFLGFTTRAFKEIFSEQKKIKKMMRPSENPTGVSVTVDGKLLSLRAYRSKVRQKKKKYYFTLRAAAKFLGVSTARLKKVIEENGVKLQAVKGVMMLHKQDLYELTRKFENMADDKLDPPKKRRQKGPDHRQLELF